MYEMKRVCRVFRLGGEYERACLARDFAKAMDVEQEFTRIGIELGENYAWWLLVLRGRNVIRRCRGLEELNY